MGAVVTLAPCACNSSGGAKLTLPHVAQGSRDATVKRQHAAGDALAGALVNYLTWAALEGVTRNLLRHYARIASANGEHERAARLLDILGAIR